MTPSNSNRNSNSPGLDVCDVLGLDPKQVRKIAIEIEPGIAIVTVGGF